jgi:lipopolysaccharide export system protein LptA
VRGQLDVRADELIAYYRERPDGTAEVWQLDANGNVRISSQTEKAFSEHATYDFDNDRLLLTGKRPRVVTGDGEISADGQIQYRTNDKVVIASGNAQAKQPDRDIRADVLTIFLRDRVQNQSRLSRIEAEKDVVVVTAKETIMADKGLYEDESGLATFSGSVKVSNDGNTLAGCRGEVNLKTGVSRMTGCGAPGSPDSRVRGVIVPGGSRTN